VSERDIGASLTRRVAGFAAGLRIADVPEPVREQAKLHILDSIGCGIAGASSELARRTLDYLAIEHRNGSCPILATGTAYGPAAAAFGNAAAMNALDFDDGFEVDGTGMGHPGATIVAAAASAPFAYDIDGPTFLTAMIAAYEINNRLIWAMQPSIGRFREVYGVCQHEAVGAAIAFGKLAGLGAPALENAIGLAATLTNVPSLRKYNWDQRPLISFKDFNAPAAEAGVRAVQFDRCGMIGSKAVLDGDTGWWRMLGSDRFDADKLVSGLGSDWTLWRNSFKPFPSCRWMHTVLEAFESALTEHKLATGEIERVTLHTSAAMARDFMDHRPATMVDAQFSLPFAVAAVAHRIGPAANWYTPETLARADLQSFGNRVEAVVDPVVDQLMSGLTRRPAGRVSVTARGRVFASALIEYPRGSAERPMSPKDIAAKFLSNTASVLGSDGAIGLLHRLSDLESEPSVAGLLRTALTVAGGDLHA
jgi:2-methylcitrate dehydratase PrpD